MSLHTSLLRTNAGKIAPRQACIFPVRHKMFPLLFYSLGAINKNVPIQVAARIKELMRENSLTQVALAEKVGLRQNTISAWLLGKKEPSIRSLWLLADYFNVDIDYLVGRKDY